MMNLGLIILRLDLVIMNGRIILKVDLVALDPITPKGRIVQNDEVGIDHP